MKIAFVIASMNTGGAERAASLMLNYWAEKGNDVTLITFDEQGKESFYALHTNVKRRYLAFTPAAGFGGKLVLNLRRIRTLKRVLKEVAPQAIIASIDQTNILTVFAAIGGGVPVFVIEQVDPSRYGVGAVWHLLRYVAYALSAGIVAVSGGVKTFFPSILQKKITVIPNPIATVKQPQVNNERHACRIIAMGRLVPQKGFDMLIDAFSIVAGRYPEWSVDIWGEGPEREPLRSRIAANNLNDKVRLCGISRNTSETFLNGDIFVLSSRFEGFPLVLGEAMAAGLAVISFDCPSGPAEMINDGKNGILVARDSIEGLAAAMERLMRDADERRRLSEQARSITLQFGTEPVVRRWEELIKGKR